MADLPEKSVWTNKPRGKGKPFAPGHDPRRALSPGRPPKPMCIPDILRSIGKLTDPATKREKMYSLCERIWKCALDGEPWAVQFIAERTEGRVASKIEARVGPALMLEAMSDEELRGELDRLEGRRPAELPPAEQAQDAPIIDLDPLQVVVTEDRPDA